MNPILWIIAFIGHLGSWCVVYNRTHATSWPRKTRKRCEKFVIAAVALVFIWFLTRSIRLKTVSFTTISSQSYFDSLYLFFAVGMGVFFIGRWIWRNLQASPASLLSSQQKLIDIQAELGTNIYLTTLAKQLKKIPFNQAHWVAVEKIEIAVERLPAGLDGLRICQLSDLHMTGQLDVAYFERIVEEVNSFEPGLIFVTGDLIDDYECLDWIDTVFGNLRAKHGVFFIRGNHDLRISDQQMLLEKLQASGMKWVGGKWLTLDIDGTTFSFTGNELPWHAGAESVTVDSIPQDDVRILLSHSPDQIRWAEPFEFDLIFAGHCHGGQIVLPLIGPIVAPSKYGVLYASGTFEIGRSTMHVSRGISGDECVRINCPPELGCFTLRSRQSQHQS